MKEKFKEYFKGNFKNMGSKAKIMLGLIAVISILIVTAVTMRKTIKVNIDGIQQTFVSYKGNVEDALKSQGIDVCDKDKIVPSLDSEISDQEEIKITKAVLIKVTIAGQEREVLTAEQTVADMLLAEQDFIKAQGGNCDDDDEVTPSRDARISANMNIKLVQVEIKNMTETEVLSYETVKNIDPNKDITSKNEVAQAGINGTKNIEYMVYKRDDGTEEKVRQSETITQVPQDEIIVEGSGHFMASRGGESAVKINKDTMTVSATSYYMGDDAITATGRRAIRSVDPNGLSTIAVDPTVIPLGSLVYIEGYGKAVAADTGTAIKGNKIDVYLTSVAECRVWGRKDGMKLGIIAYPGEW